MQFIKKTALFSFIILLTTACGHNAEEHSATNTGNQIVSAVEVQSMQPIKEIVLPGELYPWDKVSIFSRVQGYVKEIYVDRGAEVKKGQLLAVLDAPEVMTELDQAYGQLVAAEAYLNETKSNFTASRLNYQRLLKVSNTPGAVSANELDLAKSKMMADSSLVASAEGNLKAAKSHYSTKTEMANYLRIEAPFDGTIIERNVSPGALISAGATNIKPLFVIENNSTLRLTVAVPEVYANAIHKTDTVSFRVNSAPDKIFHATFGRSAESIVEKNRVMMIEFDVDNASGELKAGMYAEANLLIQRLSPSLFVPKTAVVNSGGSSFIIHQVEDKAAWIPVTKGMTLDTLVEIFGAVDAGERIVLEASEEIRDGNPIQLEEQRY